MIYDFGFTIFMPASNINFLYLTLNFLKAQR